MGEMHRNNQFKTQRNLYFNTDYESLYNFDLKEKTFSDTKCAKIKSYVAQAKSVV